MATAIAGLVIETCVAIALLRLGDPTTKVHYTRGTSNLKVNTIKTNMYNYFITSFNNIEHLFCKLSARARRSVNINR